MRDWTVDDIAEQAKRGGVNRQQAEQLIRTIHQLETFLDQATTDAARWKAMWFDDNDFWQKQVDDLCDAIIRHRNVHRETDDVHRRHLANHMLWALVDGDDRAEQEWHNANRMDRHERETVTVADAQGLFIGGPDSVEWLRSQRQETDDA